MSNATLEERTEEIDMTPGWGDVIYTLVSAAMRRGVDESARVEAVKELYRIASYLDSDECQLRITSPAVYFACYQALID
jgi:hypothetical protein